MHFASRIQTWASINYSLSHNSPTNKGEHSFCVHRQGQEASGLIVTFYGCCLKSMSCISNMLFNIWVDIIMKVDFNVQLLLILLQKWLKMDLHFVLKFFNLFLCHTLSPLWSIPTIKHRHFTIRYGYFLKLRTDHLGEWLSGKDLLRSMLRVQIFGSSALIHSRCP